MDYLNFALCLMLACLAIPLILSFTKNVSQATPLRLPPGPPTIPIFGNLFSLGKKPRISLADLAKTHGPLMTLQLGRVTTMIISLADLAKTHGPLMTLQLGRVTTMIISSAEVAKEVLQKNDISFCNRTVIDAVRAIDHHQNSLIWLPVSPHWRNLRKMCNTHVFAGARLDESQRLRRD